MRNVNRQWRLRSHPDGMPKPGDWELVEAPVPDPGAGEMLVRSIYLDVAPYMRGRISPQRNYAAGVTPGDVMIGGSIGEVLRSNSPKFAAGEVIVHDFRFGWQDYAVLSDAGVRRIDTAQAPSHSALSFLGLNGATAYWGLIGPGAMKAGDTVVVSAAAGSVGQLVGQIAKIAGCRAVAIASSDEKLTWCRELGYDAGINYRTAPDLAAAVGEACPDGVDLFFDNTADSIHDAVLQNLATHARVVVCGTVALADRFEAADIGLRFLRQILINRARVEGFLVLDYADRFEEA